MPGEVVPFGKYKGQPVEVMAADTDYCECSPHSRGSALSTETSTSRVDRCQRRAITRASLAWLPPHSR